MKRFVPFLCLLVFGCQTDSSSEPSSPASSDSSALQIDPVTGVPYAKTFQIPLQGFDASDFGFGFGSINDHFCLASSQGECVMFGAHLGRDTQVKRTPVGTPVFAPADGIVRISTDERFGGFGSDSAKNPFFKGCLLLLEHEFLNGQAIVSLLGHVQCEKTKAYDEKAQQGNPAVGTIVRRGQYVAHVASYWTGATTGTDWHHLHWAMRKGPYVATQQAEFVSGYALPNEFRFNALTHAKEHPIWIDPFVVVAASGDPQQVAENGVRHHPAGSLLQNADGELYVVTDDSHVAKISPAIAVSDRYDAAHAVTVSDAELACYAFAPNVSSVGKVMLYKHAGSSAVAVANLATLQRQDFLRWEALLSWGFTNDDIQMDASKALVADTVYAPQGFRGLRPGSLVKSDDAAEVCIVRPDGVRQPIASADVFEALGYAWEQVYSVPSAVLDTVAGFRSSQVITWESIHTCAVSSACPGGSSNCGGGSDPCSVLSCPSSSICELLPDGKAHCVNSSSPICQGECTAGVSESCTACPGVLGMRTCSTTTCTWSPCQKPAVPELCTDGIDNDCNGVLDCQDPACTVFCQGSGGMSAPGGSAGMGGMGGIASAMGTGFPLRVHYVGDAYPGSIVMNAWWQPPADFPRVWGAVSACTDPVSGDGKLDCVLSLPHGTTSFEFQFDLPNGGYWGDVSCFPKGGCGSTNGTVTLQHAETGEAVAYELLPNTPGEPYLKGRVALFP